MMSRALKCQAREPICLVPSFSITAGNIGRTT